MSTVWLIADPREDAALLEGLLGNFAVRCFASLHSFYCLAYGQSPHALIIDSFLDEKDITKLFAFLHKQDWHPAVVIQGHLQLKKAYLPRLFFLEERRDFSQIVPYIANICAMTRDHSLEEHFLRYKNIGLDLIKWELSIDPEGRESSLSLKEGSLLRLFMENPNRCFTRDEIKDKIWQRIAISPRTIDSHISRLRRKLKEAEASIECIYGDGYIFC